MKAAAMLAVASLLGASAPSQAHVTWANGQSVPDWVKTICCGEKDAHELRAEQVTQHDDGTYTVDELPGVIIPANQMAPSPDGHWWVFYTTITATNVFHKAGDKIFRCFFGPISM